jgi:hypothetical protein
MRVENNVGNPLVNQVAPGVGQNEAAQGPAAGRRGDTSAPRANVDSGGYSPDANFLRLVEQARSVPDVRADVVAQVATRLAAGEYDTPEAARKTADAILGHPSP